MINIFKNNNNIKNNNNNNNNNNTNNDNNINKSNNDNNNVNNTNNINNNNNSNNSNNNSYNINNINNSNISNSNNNSNKLYISLVDGDIESTFIYIDQYQCSDQWVPYELAGYYNISKYYENNGGMIYDTGRRPNKDMPTVAALGGRHFQ